jgi:RNA polymerase sigma factor (sigma-70 family)
MRRYTRMTDTELLVAVAEGDQRAFEVFYRRFLPMVTGFHYRRTRRAELAFDLTAETFATVVAGCDRFDPERGEAAAWVFGIAANKLRESLRRGRVEASARERLAHEPVVIDDEDLARVEAMASEADEARVEAALRTLPPHEREAVLARVIDERPYEQIASEARCSEAVVRQRVHRGLRRMRTQMEDPV